MRIELHIDRVILEGVGDQRHARLIADAVRAELSTLLAGTPRTTWRPGRLRRVEAPAVRSAGLPAVLGRRIASAIHSGLTAAPGRRSGA
ncbi:MAG TPA: hypothetical protein VGX25_00125 [Actinophytocola sp.]|uniref:hypothetical protein n=1 Tax=Actinophytocola sp. TaxID=1872138 RepID=UPI002DDD4B9E|nr:hypothetical protein [Actinophytocola sp.]HEV2777783.1 hypothetical protein [Actinophytocola sp.]